MWNQIARWLAHANEVLLQRLWWLVSVVVFGIGAALLTWRDELLPEDIKQNWRVLKMLPHWSWGWWALAIALLIMAVILESS